MILLNFKHPKDVNLTYIDHLCFTWKESFRSLLSFFIMFIHGIIPPLFDWWYSEHIKKAKERVDRINEGRTK